MHRGSHQNRFELPAFSASHRIVQHARAEANRGYFELIAARLAPGDQQKLSGLLARPPEESESPLQGSSAKPSVPQPRK